MRTPREDLYQVAKLLLLMDKLKMFDSYYLNVLFIRLARKWKVEI